VHASSRHGPPLFVPKNSAYATRARLLLRRLPPLSGEPIHLFRARSLREGRREVHAGSFLRERSIGFNCQPAEFARICVHELFHFVWLRLGNPRRLSFEGILRQEHAARAHGELGWSAEWRKKKLTERDIRTRSRLWREYCCESFCDTAAWLYSGVRRHEEFTLGGRQRRRREGWFSQMVGTQLRV
jgi:hypothetical protein